MRTVLAVMGLMLGAAAGQAGQAGTGAQITEAQITVFHCVLENGVQVRVYQEGDKFRYVYGLPRQEPQLELVRRRDEVEILPDNGAGPSRFGHVKFANEGFVYEVYYTYELADPDNDHAQGLRVYRVNDPAEPVFDEVCGKGEVTDRIYQLE